MSGWGGEANAGGRHCWLEIQPSKQQTGCAAAHLVQGLWISSLLDFWLWTKFIKHFICRKLLRGTGGPWQEFQFYNLTAVDIGQEPQFLYLSFLICKMDIIVLPQSRVTVRIRGSSLRKMPLTNIVLTG